MRVARLGLVALLACNREAPITKCTDDLRGVYEVETTATEREPARWHVLDNRHSLEIYPLFDDTGSAPPNIEMAPRVIDLERAPDALVGHVTRRYMKGATRCDAKANARITACKAGTLEIVLADPQPPLTFEPCAWGAPASSRRERWHRR